MLLSDNFSLNLLFAHFAALFVSSSVTTTMHIILPYFFLFNSCYTSGSFSVLVPVSTFDAVLRPTDHCRRPKPCFLMSFLLQFFFILFSSACCSSSHLCCLSLSKQDNHNGDKPLSCTTIRPLLHTHRPIIRGPGLLTPL